VEWREQGDKHLVSEVTGIIVGKELYYYGTNGDVAHGEARNLADSPEYKDVVLKMQAELDKAFPYLPQRIGELKDIPKPTSQQNSSELWNAVKNGDLKQAQTLLEQGTAANSFDPGGMHNSCIAQAVRNKNAKMVSLLLKHGANMHQRNFWQQTAWSECINAGSDEIMSLLKDARSKERYN
jgi:ankyrin repeat protein